MNRIEKSKEKYTQLFGEGIGGLHTTDPDFQEILSHFLFGEVFYQGKIDDKLRELITLVVLAVSQSLHQLKAHVSASLKIGLTPIEIKEAIYQCAPYIGFPKTLDALSQVNEVFTAEGIALPVESQQTTGEADRLEKGDTVQTAIFGDIITKMRSNAPSNLSHIQDYLSAFCFGDFYTRCKSQLN